MERLTFESGKYIAMEAAVHIARYSVARGLAGGKRILDIACGEGYGSYLMATRWGGKHVTAVDISQEAVDAARRNFNAENITYEVGEAEVLSKRYPPGSFDLVISLETIEHLADPEKFLNGIKAVCTEDATIIISCPNDPAHYRDHTTHNPFHLKTYTAAQFFDMAEAILGPCKQKFVGAPVLGFGNFAVDGPLVKVGESMKSMLNFVETASLPLSVPPDDTIALDDASYYIGVWSHRDYIPFEATVALYPSALNSSAQAELSAEVAKLRTDIWDLTHAGHQTEMSSLRDRLREQELQCSAYEKEIIALRSAVAGQQRPESAGSTAVRDEISSINTEGEGKSGDDDRLADLQHAVREQALRLSVLSAENRLAKEGVAELRRQLSQAQTDLARVPWKAVSVYRRVRGFIPKPVMRIIRKTIYRSR